MKKKMIIDEKFWEVFPEGAIYLVQLSGIDNSIDESKDDYFKSLLSEATSAAKKYFVEETFSDNAVVKIWREAFTKFKTKKGARSSIEALLKRANQGHEFSPINPLVDIYNSVSLEFALPCGGEDIEAIAGDLHLGCAVGGEGFRPLGQEEDAPALEGEIIYYDDEGAVCRCLNWREAQRTMLTPETKNAVLVIETISPSQRERAELAVAKLRELSENYFKVESKSYVLTKDLSEVVLI